MKRLARRSPTGSTIAPASATLRHHLLDEPLPAGTGWWFTLGSVLLFGLDRAGRHRHRAGALLRADAGSRVGQRALHHDQRPRRQSFLRGLHHWGASVVVVAAVVHLVRVVFFGSYRKPREVNWIVGLLLLQVILAFGLTGLSAAVGSARLLGDGRHDQHLAS